MLTPVGRSVEPASIGADIQQLGITRAEADRADIRRREALILRLPGFPAIGGFPHTVRAADVENILFIRLLEVLYR